MQSGVIELNLFLWSTKFLIKISWTWSVLLACVALVTGPPTAGPAQTDPSPHELPAVATRQLTNLQSILEVALMRIKANNSRRFFKANLPAILPNYLKYGKLSEDYVSPSTEGLWGLTFFPTEAIGRAESPWCANPERLPSNDYNKTLRRVDDRETQNENFALLDPEVPNGRNRDWVYRLNSDCTDYSFTYYIDLSDVVGNFFIEMAKLGYHEVLGFLYHYDYEKMHEMRLLPSSEWEQHPKRAWYTVTKAIFLLAKSLRNPLMKTVMNGGTYNDLIKFTDWLESKCNDDLKFVGMIHRFGHKLLYGDSDKEFNQAIFFRQYLDRISSRNPNVTYDNDYLLPKFIKAVRFAQQVFTVTTEPTHYCGAPVNDLTMRDVFDTYIKYVSHYWMDDETMKLLDKVVKCGGGLTWEEMWEMAKKANAVNGSSMG